MFFTRTLLSIASLCISYYSFAQSPAIRWEKTYGGTSTDFCYNLSKTQDGGFIMIGHTTSNDDDVTNQYGAEDIWLVKTDANGVLQWQRSYGGSGEDLSVQAQQTLDGGYIIVGSTTSTDGDVTSNHGGADAWLIKTDATGAIQWQKTYGGSGDEEKYYLYPLTNGYIIGGQSESADGDVTSNHGSSDIWLAQLDATGNIIWQRSYGGSGVEQLYAVSQADTGFIFAGATASADGDVTGAHGSLDAWVVKVDTAGNIIWQKTIGGSGDEIALSLFEVSGSNIITGFTYSANGDMSNHHGDMDAWMGRVDEDGNLGSVNCYGGSGPDYFNSFIVMSNYDMIFTGSTGSSDGDVSSAPIGRDVWVARLTPAGNMVWENSYGGSALDFGSRIVSLSDTSYVVGGTVASNDIDVSGFKGARDYWLLRLGTGTTDVHDIALNQMSVYPTVTTGVVQVKTGAANDAVMVVQSLDGRELQRQHISGNSAMNIAGLPAGMYIIKAHAGNAVRTWKVMKL